MLKLKEWSDTSKTELPKWRIFRKWGTSDIFLGIVDAPNEQIAIDRAIKKFEITNPEHLKRIMAQQRD